MANVDLGNLNGAYVDQIKAEVENFIGLIGWENLGSYNEASLIQWAANNAAPSENQQAVYEGLFNLMPADIQAKAPWAEFGISAADYQNKAMSLNSTYYEYTGMGIDAATLRAAIKESWSTDKLLQDMQSQASFMQTFPWLASGGKYTDVANSYAQTYGTGPKDQGTLAAWYRFNQSARTSSPTTLATTTLPQSQPSLPTAKQTAEVR